MKKCFFLISAIAIVFTVFPWLEIKVNDAFSAYGTFDITPVKHKLNEIVLKDGQWPVTIVDDETMYRIAYTFDDQLVDYIKKQLQIFRSDYSSVVVIDNNTGAILAAVDYRAGERRFGTSLTFSNFHPGASIFKIVTTAELLEHTDVSSHSMFSFRGRSTTLYKYQLLDKPGRWNRYQNLRSAFAVSNNVIYGQAAIRNVNPGGLYDMAVKFGFNRSLMSEIDLPLSMVEKPSNDYELAQMATGFNKTTSMSPLHGALLASVAANMGNLVSPRLVTTISRDDEERPRWTNPISSQRIVEPETAKDLQDLMEYTVAKGTARKSFRKFPKSLMTHVRIGGKTGSITGGVPFGKRDWFVAYAMPRDTAKGNGISICVMNVNVKKWHVRSSFLAKTIIEHYYKATMPVVATETERRHSSRRPAMHVRTNKVRR
jgi:membrane peptidoglycan carboxypeptidase